MSTVAGTEMEHRIGWGGNAQPRVSNKGVQCGWSRGGSHHRSTVYPLEERLVEVPGRKPRKEFTRKGIKMGR